MKKILIYFLFFAIIGESMIRFDQKFTLMEDTRIVKISTDIAITPEYESIKNGTHIAKPEDLKIMVIGDSYIHGGGIEFKDNFSQNLKEIVNTNAGNFDKGLILDVSIPNSNNLDNNETYFQFVDQFQPDLVIIGYNLNDTDGNLDKGTNSETDKKKRNGKGNFRRRY